MEQYDGLEGRGDDDELIHVPMRSRASVLQERNLLRLLEEEREEDAPEAFARWARGRDSGCDGRLPRRRGPGDDLEAAPLASGGVSREEAGRQADDRAL